MKIRFLTILQNITGTGTTEIAESKTVKELLIDLAKCYGEEMEKWLFVTNENNSGWEDEPRFSNNVVILVNGRAIDVASCWNMMLRETDEIVIFPKISGG
ncbi:MAG: MoaD/ThiS family protein [Thermacetogeniaceae bacterium]